MRIALAAPLAESVPPKLYGGTERVVATLCRGLTEAGAEVTLFASGDSAAPARLVPIVDKALRLRHPPLLEPQLAQILQLAELRKRAREFDVIHNHNDAWLLPLTELTSTPVLTTLHGRLDVELLAPVLRAFPNAGFISISDSQRAPLPGLRWLRTIHHGLELPRYRFNPRPGSYLAFLGRISPEKRPDWAIEIALRSGVPLKIAAKIEGGPSSLYWERVIKPLVDGRFIEYVGEIGDDGKSEFLGNALALLFPIDWPEPFGLVCIEALATGTPVLARPCGAVPELLENERTGFIENDVARLAARVHDLDRIDRGACRAWVERRFSVERMIADHLAVYQDALKLRAVRPFRAA